MIKSLLSALLVAALASITNLAHAAPPPGVTTFAARLADNSGPLTGAHNFAFAIYAAPTGGSALWTEAHTSVMLDQGLVNIALGSMTPLTSTVFDGSARYLEVLVDGSALDARVPIFSVPYAVRAGIAESAEIANSLSAGLQSQLDADYLPLGASLSCSAGQAVTGIAGGTGNVTCGGVQTPLTAGCGSGQYLRSFSAAGVASCFADGKGVAAMNGGLTGTAVGDNIELAIAMNAINSQHIIDGTITSDDIGDAAVGTSEINNSSILSEDIADGAIGTDDVGDGSLTGTDIMNGSIMGGDISTDAIGAGHLLQNSVASSEVVDGSLTSDELAAGACDTTQIATNAVTNVKMADNAIGSAEIVNNSVGPDDVELTMFTSYTNISGPGSVLLVSGDNDIFVPATYVATSAGECLVSVMVRLANNGAATTGGANVRIIYRQSGNATTFNEVTWQAHASPYTSTGVATFGKTNRIPISSAGTWELGCRVNASGDWIGDNAVCQVTAYCQ
jgi:hypothetical protein